MLEQINIHEAFETLFGGEEGWGGGGGGITDEKSVFIQIQNTIVSVGKVSRHFCP